MKKRLGTTGHILLGIPALFLVGAFFHFLYALTGNALAIGFFVPVNESVFEHTKMASLPVFLWWSVYYVLHRKELSANRWLTASLLSLLVTTLSIPMLFYFYTSAFGFESVVIDCLILLVALTFGQLMGLHMYRHGEGIDFRIALSSLLLAIVLMGLGTLFPPKLPLFLDITNGSYGIFQFKFS